MVWYVRTPFRRLQDPRRSPRQTELALAGPDATQETPHPVANDPINARAKPPHAPPLPSVLLGTSRRERLSCLAAEASSACPRVGRGWRKHQEGHHGPCSSPHLGAVRSRSPQSGSSRLGRAADGSGALVSRRAADPASKCWAASKCFYHLASSFS
ncbi:hypothetical protein L1887_48615 [Cichorium endivia]|nr:hypothetical protein L1887_48615 [Cichorium endivia]